MDWHKWLHLTLQTSFLDMTLFLPLPEELFFPPTCQNVFLNIQHMLGISEPFIHLRGWSWSGYLLSSTASQQELEWFVKRSVFVLVDDDHDDDEGHAADGDDDAWSKAWTLSDQLNPYTVNPRQNCQLVHDKLYLNPRRSLSCLGDANKVQVFSREQVLREQWLTRCMDGPFLFRRITKKRSTDLCTNNKNSFLIRL